MGIDIEYETFRDIAKALYHAAHGKGVTIVEAQELQRQLSTAMRIHINGMYAEALEAARRANAASGAAEALSMKVWDDLTCKGVLPRFVEGEKSNG